MISSPAHAADVARVLQPHFSCGLWLEAIWVVGLGISLKIVMFWEKKVQETSSVSNLGMMGDHLCRTCLNHWCTVGEKSN